MLRVRQWDPRKDFEELREQMQRLLTGQPVSTARREVFPAVNLWHSPSGVALTAELPGLGPDTLSITLDRHAVTISGGPAVGDVAASATVHRRERPTGPFARTIELPFEVDPDRSEASYERGVLTLKLARPEEHLPKKVPIRTA